MDKTEEMKPYEALQLLAKEKGISPQLLMEKIKAAIIIAIKKDYSKTETKAEAVKKDTDKAADKTEGVKKEVYKSEPKTENIIVEFDEEKKDFNVAILKTVADEITDPANEITKEAAAKHTKRKLQAGDIVSIKIDTRKFGRIAAQTAKQVIKQGIKDVERAQLIEQWGGLHDEAATVTVLKIEPKTGNAYVDLNGNEVMLFAKEMIPGEELKVGDMKKVYVSGVSASDTRPMLKISRTKKELVKRLFELEVPEVHDGTVEIKAISREAGSRSKVAVISHNPDVDALGACIGPNRQRISKVCQELNGEKMDVVFYSDDPKVFIAQALKPSDVIKVEIPDPEVKACTALVPDNQLSLAIGNKGQNAKLAAKLTGYKIDIRPESGFFEGLESAQKKENEDADTADEVQENAASEELDSAENIADEANENNADEAVEAVENDTEEAAENVADEEDNAGENAENDEPAVTE